MTNPTFFTVVADYKSVVVDLASDVDADPTLGPVTAKVTFTPILANGDVILATDASPRPTGYVAAPIVARIDTDGRLKLRVEPDGDRDDFASVEDFPLTGNTAKVYFAIDEQTFYRWTGSAYAETYPYAAVRLLADTALLELASDLYYRVSFSEVVFNGGPGYIAPFTFQAPSTDVELNLIEVMRQPGQPASGITKIAPGAVRLEDGEIVWSFAGVDILDPIPFEPSFTSAGITDSTATGRALVTASSPSAARQSISANDFVGAIRPQLTNGSADDYGVIQAALNTGSDVVLCGPIGETSTATVKTSATLILTAVGQRLITVNARISPTFRGDAVRVTKQNQHVDVEINGALQPVSGDYEQVAAIRIGLADQSENPKNASVAGSRVTGSWKGNGIIWEHGAHINFGHFSVDFGVTYDGIRATPNCDDNNEGNFHSTRVSNCGRYGYWIQDNALVPTSSSRGHMFSNSKAFNCLRNFVIETDGNVGFIFSENGVNPDQFTSTSGANSIAYAETNSMYASVSDSGTGNQISGKNAFGRWDTRNLGARKLIVNNLFSGYRELTHTANGTFTDSITGTNNNVTVDHNTAGSGVRSDSFQNVSVSGVLDFGTGDTTISRSAAGVLAVEGVVVPTVSSTNTLSSKTLQGTKETVHAITDGAAFEINPANGGIQTITLGAARTPKATNFTAGQSMTLMIAATTYAITWTDATLTPTWIGGAAPALSTTKSTVIVLWKVSSTIYASLVGYA